MRLDRLAYKDQRVLQALRVKLAQQVHKDYKENRDSLELQAKVLLTSGSKLEIKELKLIS